MRVALEKVDGIESVRVTLKRGVAHITLEQGNTVTLAGLRRIVKDAGYQSRDAVVTVRGTVRARENRLMLEVSGTSELFDLVADRGESPADAERAVDRVAEVTGAITNPDTKAIRETLLVQSLSVVR